MEDDIGTGDAAIECTLGQQVGLKEAQVVRSIGQLREVRKLGGTRERTHRRLHRVAARQQLRDELAREEAARAGHAGDAWHPDAAGSAREICWTPK